MKIEIEIEIERIANGLLARVSYQPTSSDPLGQPLSHSGTFYACDGTDLMGRIAEWISQEYGFDRTEGEK